MLNILLLINFPFPGVGVYISRIEENSVAERAGLRPGDTILEVNGTPFLSISHEEALKVKYFLHVLSNFIKIYFFFNNNKSTKSFQFLIFFLFKFYKV